MDDDDTNEDDVFVLRGTVDRLDKLVDSVICDTADMLDRLDNAIRETAERLDKLMVNICSVVF